MLFVVLSQAQNVLNGYISEMFLLFQANIADSRCIASVNGHAIQMSIEHKPSDDIELQRITNHKGTMKGYVENGRINGNLTWAADRTCNGSKKIEINIEQQCLNDIWNLMSYPVPYLIP